MNTFLKNKYILLFFVYSFSMLAGFANDTTPPPPDPSPEAVPINAGIFLLGLVALVYGVTKKK